MSTQPRVGLDVDGVIADFSGFYLKTLGLDPAQNKTWDITQSYGPEVAREVGRLVGDPTTWISVKPLVGAIDAATRILESSRRVIFMSSFPQRFFLLRQWWLEQYFGRPKEWYLMSVAGGDKASTARGLGLDYFVEDKRSTANAMAEEGITSILVPTAYTNDGWIHPDVRVQSLRDFARDLVNR